jgi:hypothetical protein
MLHILNDIGSGEEDPTRDLADLLNTTIINRYGMVNNNASIICIKRSVFEVVVFIAISSAK